MKGLVAIAAVFCALFGSAVSAAQLELVVVNGGRDLVETPICTEVELPAGLKAVGPEELAVVMADKDGATVPGQLVREAKGRVCLYWVAPKVAADSKTTWTATITPGSPQPGFTYRDNPGNYRDLLFDGRKVTRYMYAHDTSTPARLHETYKVFHHVYDGDTPLTKGPDGENPYVQGLYTHHRGIYIGWNKLKHAGGTNDWWHMSGVFMVHREFAEQVAGPVLGRSVLRIDWIDKQAKPVIAETRKVTVFRVSDLTVLLLDFETALKAAGGDVYLDGDPEHAGFQYRPHNAVAEGPKDVKAKYLFHNDSIDPHRDQNLPWVGMSYGLDGRRYSVLHLNHPDNPTPSVYSAYRDYGRFGTFFRQEIKAGDVLELKYRLIVTRGDLPDRADAQGRYLAFTAPPRVDRATWRP